MGAPISSASAFAAVATLLSQDTLSPGPSGRSTEGSRPSSSAPPLCQPENFTSMVNRRPIETRHCSTLFRVAGSRGSQLPPQLAPCSRLLSPVDKRQLPLYCIGMIRRFGHRGLKRLYENDDRRGVNSELVEKTARVLARLDVATLPEQLNLPGFRLHRLEGDLAGYWSVTVEGEWRIIFSFDVENTTDVDLVEYH